MNTHPYTETALKWLTGTSTKVLLWGANFGVWQMLQQLGHQVTLIDPDYAKIQRFSQYGDGVLCGHVHNLPFVPWQFDTVLCCQNFHTLDTKTALREMVRVLKPGGFVSTIYAVRDDAIPWMKQLISLIQTIDPLAMQGSHNFESTCALDKSHYFPIVERRSFYSWMSVSDQDIAKIVQCNPSIQRATPSQRNQVLTKAQALCMNSEGGLEPLRLGYEIHCVRAQACQDELTSPISFESALHIW